MTKGLQAWSEIPPGEMASTGPEALPSNHSLPGETTYGPAQDECSDYMSEDSDNTSVYSESDENSELHANEVSAAVLENAKRALVNQLMQQVWVRFDNDWAEKFIPCAGGASRQRVSTSAQGTVQKRHREEDDDNSFSDDHGRASKRSIPQQTFSLPFAMYCISPDRERSNYHGYVRRELPRLVRSRLESAVSLQFQTLVSALDEIIQGCMDQLLIDYETARATP
jgi:hypothetical protein